MGTIVLEKSGDLRKAIFYRFDVPFDDDSQGEEPTPEWIMVPRTPKDALLRSKGEDPWMYIAEGGDLDTAVSIKDCRLDPTHETHFYYTRFIGHVRGGKRISPFIPTKNFCCFAVSAELHRHVEALHVRGARMDAIDLMVEATEEKVLGFWALQCNGRITRRMPKPVGVANRCPHCGKGKIVCESCSYWGGTCEQCHKPTVVVASKHEGQSDKRIPIDEHQGSEIVEGKSWDGSDLVSSQGISFASKRFIDWLLRIHAAPFYAEPVWFCVDGMSDQQKKWFDELQKPLEV